MHPYEDPRSTESDSLTAKAEAAQQAGDFEEARRLYLLASALEEDLAFTLEGKFSEERSIFAINAVSLSLKAQAFARGKLLVEKFLKEPYMLTLPGRKVLLELYGQCTPKPTPER